MLIKDKVIEIFNGWKNYLTKDPQMKEEAERRLAICIENKCNKCTSKYTCKICGCYLPAKTFNKDSHCPINKW